MPIIGLILTISQIVGLIQRGLTTATAIATEVRRAKDALTVTRDSGDVLQASEVSSAIEEAIAKVGQTGDKAAGRIDRRADTTGEP